MLSNMEHFPMLSDGVGREGRREGGREGGLALKNNITIIQGQAQSYSTCASSIPRTLLPNYWIM